MIITEASVISLEGIYLVSSESLCAKTPRSKNNLRLNLGIKKGET